MPEAVGVAPSLRILSLFMSLSFAGPALSCQGKWLKPCMLRGEARGRPPEQLQGVGRLVLALSIEDPFAEPTPFQEVEGL